ncbi:hypothetical protein [Bdellovibrio bacteriovorus]|uniref:hypothetical protein n=1 Tax=Bdellovibrio TaxID=958 RepID=UPI0035A96EF6
MLLNIRTILAVTLTCLSFSAHAQKAAFLEAGKYQLISGEKALCRSLSISEGDLQAKRISIGGLYDFQVGNSVHSIESDIDPECEFREQNRIENRSNETVLVRVNEELCKGTLRSKTVSAAMIRPNEIQIRHQVDGAEVNCVWQK